MNVTLRKHHNAFAGYFFTLDRVGDGRIEATGFNTAKEARDYAAAHELIVDVVFDVDYTTHRGSNVRRGVVGVEALRATMRGLWQARIEAWAWYHDDPEQQAGEVFRNDDTGKLSWWSE